MAPRTLQLIRRPSPLKISDTILFPASRQRSARAPRARVAQDRAKIAKLGLGSHRNVFRQRAVHCSCLFILKRSFPIIVVVFVVPSTEAFALLEPPCRHSRDQGYHGEGPERHDDVAALDAPGEQPPAYRGPRRTPDGRHARRDAVDGAQDLQAGRAVCEDDCRGREREGACKSAHDQEAGHDDLFRGVAGDEADERRDEEYDWVDQEGDAQAG